MDPRVAAAVHENAAWCDLVCRTHGLPTAFGARTWHTARRSPPFYPDAVTLDPAATAEEVLGPVDAGPGCSVKDSFAALDLAPHGFRVLFEAQWIHRPPAAAAAAPTWRRTTEGVPDAPSVAAFAGPSGRVIAHLHGDVVGLSNLEGTDWPAALAAITAAFPRRAVVGYESHADLPGALAVGFRTIGPLRVWLKPDI